MSDGFGLSNLVCHWVEHEEQYGAAEVTLDPTVSLKRVSNTAFSDSTDGQKGTHQIKLSNRPVPHLVIASLEDHSLTPLLSSIMRPCPATSQSPKISISFLFFLLFHVSHSDSDSLTWSVFSILLFSTFSVFLCLLIEKKNSN